MIIIVKHGFCEKLFFDETGKRLAALRSAKLFGAEKAVVGSDKTVKYETGIENLSDKPAGENRRYTLKQDSVLVASARPLYAADTNHFTIPKSPRPLGLEIEMIDGEQWRVDRDKDNSVKIYTPDGAGKLSDFFSTCPQVFELPKGSNIYLWAGVYAMVGYMMHEDDIYPV